MDPRTQIFLYKIYPFVVGDRTISYSYSVKLFLDANRNNQYILLREKRFKTVTRRRVKTEIWNA